MNRTARIILDATLELSGLTEEQIAGKSRRSNIVRWRQIAMHLMRRRTGLSLDGIGEIFGGRDHSTVIYSVNTSRNREGTEEDWRVDLELTNRLASRRIEAKREELNDLGKVISIKLADVIRGINPTRFWTKSGVYVR